MIKITQQNGNTKNRLETFRFPKQEPISNSSNKHEINECDENYENL